MPDILAGLNDPSGFTREDLEQMHAGALRVLDELGMAVENQYALQALAAAGVRIEGVRAYFQPGFNPACRSRSPSSPPRWPW